VRIVAVLFLIETDSYPGHEDRIDFVMIAAEGFITFGAPAHRFETLTKAASKVLELEATFLVFPGSFVGFFEDPARKNTHIQRTIYCTSSLVLGKLQRVYDVYWEVCHDRCSAIDGTMRIKAILRGGSEYNAVIQTALFFLLGAFITPLAFGGSFIDAIVAGVVSAVISFVQRLFASISSGMTPIKSAPHNIRIECLLTHALCPESSPSSSSRSQPGC
jgi:uncharacterized membrane protein YjjP (DUF1212 family)